MMQNRSVIMVDYAKHSLELYDFVIILYIKKKWHICYKYKQILVEPLTYFVGEVYFYIVVFNRCIVNSFECLRVATNQRMLSYKEVLTFLAFSSLWLNCLIGLGTWFK